jgi:hypothetical protein
MSKGTSLADLAWTLTIRTREDLAQLHGPHPLPRSRRGKVRIEVAGIPSQRSKALEAKLNSVANTCGCSEGATAAIIGALLGIAAYVVRDSLSLWVGVLFATAGLFIGGMAGKAIGLRRADVKFRRTVAQIEEELQNSTSAKASAGA